jgi:hypothetical protein
MQAPQRYARFGAKLINQHPAYVLIGGQRLSLPPTLIQRKHPLAVQVFAQRVSRGETAKLGDDVSVTT